MARTVTLTTMINRVRRETDQEYDLSIVSAPFVTDAFITDAINEGIAEIAQYLVTTDPDRMRTSTSVTLVPGTESYSLPATFQAIRGVDYPVGSYTATVHPYAFEERNDLQQPWPAFASPEGAPFRYHVHGSGVNGSAGRISFRPVPSVSATVTVHYVAVPAALSSGADTFDGIIGLEAYAVAYAKDKVFSRTQDREGQAIAKADMERVKSNIKMEAGRRDRSGLEVVAQVRDRDNFRGRSRLPW
jgi:hypothetical protein